MISKIVIMLAGIILALVLWILLILRLYKKQELRANILQEQLDIRRQIERGNRADKILWEYHNVTYLNNTYNIKVKNITHKNKSLQKQ